MECFSFFWDVHVPVPERRRGRMTNLLERDQSFKQLSALLQLASTGQGRTVLISGEAGIGKTALVEQFVTQQGNATRRLWGACEALFTPRPLGPLYDLATQVGGP